MEIGSGHTPLGWKPNLESFDWGSGWASKLSLVSSKDPSSIKSIALGHGDGSATPSKAIPDELSSFHDSKPGIISDDKTLCKSRLDTLCLDISSTGQSWLSSGRMLAALELKVSSYITLGTSRKRTFVVTSSYAQATWMLKEITQKRSEHGVPGPCISRLYEDTSRIQARCDHSLCVVESKGNTLVTWRLVHSVHPTGQALC